MIKNNLPNKPSELLMVALSDLEAIEKNPTYSIDLTILHSPLNHRWLNGDTRCAVCLAGAVMAQTLKVKPDINVPLNRRFLSKDTYQKLKAIDYFRQGQISEGLDSLGYNIDKYPNFVFSIDSDDFESEYGVAGVPYSVERDYRKNKEDFKNYIQGLIGILQSEGL